MSSYLNIYLKKKDTHEYLLLDSWSRSTDAYQFVSDNLNPAWAGNEEKYTDITTKDLDVVIRDIAKGKKSAMERLNAYKEYLGRLVDCIDPDCPNAPKPRKSGIAPDTGIDDCLTEIQGWKELYNDLDSTQQYIYFLRGILQSSEDNCNGFEGMAMNID